MRVKWMRLKESDGPLFKYKNNANQVELITKMKNDANSMGRKEYIV